MCDNPDSGSIQKRSSMPASFWRAATPRLRWIHPSHKVAADGCTRKLPRNRLTRVIGAPGAMPSPLRGHGIGYTLGMPVTAPTSEAEIIEQVVACESGGLSPEAARAILTMTFDRPTTSRIRQLL